MEKCDFCPGDGAVWDYPARNFTMTTVAIGPSGIRLAPCSFKGYWKACEECAALIEADEWLRLAARVTRASSFYPRMCENPVVLEKFIGAIVALHLEFQSNRTGERVALDG